MADLSQSGVFTECASGQTDMRPRLLDLFCGAGGAAMGYHRAGFNVVGVDIKPQPHYPFSFYKADALTWPLEGYAAIHASPPCQAYSAMKHAPGAKDSPNLIWPIRRRLRDTGLPYVIENVEGAPLLNPVVICGSMFGLSAQGCELRRHRLFESNLRLDVPSCKHSDGPVIGVYGGHARRRSAKHGGRGTRDVWDGGHCTAAREALGIDWMTLAELSEAIPPAYTEYIGYQLKAALIAPSVA